MPSASVALVPLGQPAQYAARDEWLREIRRHLQHEVVDTSHALFEASKGADLRSNVDGIVDRFLTTTASP